MTWSCGLLAKYSNIIFLLVTLKFNIGFCLMSHDSFYWNWNNVFCACKISAVIYFIEASVDKEGMHKNKRVECLLLPCKDIICRKMIVDHITKTFLALLWKFRCMALIVTFFPQSKPIPTLHIMMRTEFIIWETTGRSTCLFHLSSHKKGKIYSKTKDDKYMEGSQRETNRGIIRKPFDV